MPAAFQRRQDAAYAAHNHPVLRARGVCRFVGLALSHRFDPLAQTEIVVEGERDPVYKTVLSSAPTRNSTRNRPLSDLVSSIAD
jgi:hypothetical protein